MKSITGNQATDDIMDAANALSELGGKLYTAGATALASLIWKECSTIRANAFIAGKIISEGEV